MCRLYGVPFVDEEVVQQALEASQRDAGAKVNVMKFSDWYVKNVYSRVVPECLDLTEIESLIDKLAKKHKVTRECIILIRGAFDKLDVNHNGSLDFDEFVEMLHTTLRAIAGELSEKRVLIFWKEIDEDG